MDVKISKVSEADSFSIKFSEINDVLSKNPDKNDSLAKFLEPIVKSNFEEFCKDGKHEEI